MDTLLAMKPGPSASGQRTSLRRKCLHHPRVDNGLEWRGWKAKVCKESSKCVEGLQLIGKGPRLKGLSDVVPLYWSAGERQPGAAQ